MDVDEVASAMQILLEGGADFNKYPAKQHAQRVAQKLGVSEGLIYLPAQPTIQFEDSDQPLPFRQRRYFFYITGSDEPDQHAVYDIQNDSLTLFIPQKTLREVIYTGPVTTVAEALAKYDVDQVLYQKELDEFTQEWQLYNDGQIYVLHPSQAPSASVVPPQRIELAKLQKAMDAARVIKDDHEITLIKKANEISTAAHKAVLQNIVKFKNEAQVNGIFLDTCVSHGAINQSYEIIAASGENAAVLHYIKNNEPFGDRQLMVLDAGAEWNCYASDVTRTFPLTGKWPSPEAKQIYDLVQEMQDAAVARLAPGTRYYNCQVTAHKVMIQGLLKLGIFHNGTAEEIFKAGTSMAFLPHGLGHHLGLDVHDVSDEPINARGMDAMEWTVYCKDSTQSPCHPTSAGLQEGMVITVEPGIYFSRFALSSLYLKHPVHSKYINKHVLAKYLPVGGVRIEDDYLITATGCENLTTAPKGEEMLAIMQQHRSASENPR